MRKFVGIGVLVVLCWGLVIAVRPRIPFVGMSRQELFVAYDRSDERSYRREGIREWITFNIRLSGGRVGWQTVFLVNDKVIGWSVNDRDELVKEYLGEFSPRIFEQEYSAIYQALFEVLRRLPQDVFLVVTDRSYPLVFTEYHQSGSGRLANSTDVWTLPDDPPTFTKGFYLIKISTELQKATDPQALQAIFAHEIAHRWLQHGAQEYSLELERQANRVIKKWGFEKEFIKATTLEFHS